MTVPDLSSLSISELREWISALNAQYSQLEEEQRTEAEQRREDITQAIDGLKALLGPVDGEPGVDSIRAVRKYDEATMGDNAGLALNLAFAGLESLTIAVLDIAQVIGAQNE